MRTTPGKVMPSACLAQGVCISVTRAPTGRMGVCSGRLRWVGVSGRGMRCGCVQSAVDIRRRRPQLGQAWPHERVLAAQSGALETACGKAPPPGGRHGAIMRTAARRPARIDAHSCGGRIVVTPGPEGAPVRPSKKGRRPA